MENEEGKDEIREAVEWAKDLTCVVGYNCKELRSLIKLGERYLSTPPGWPEKQKEDHNEFGSCEEYICADYQRGFNKAIAACRLARAKEIDLK